MLVMCIVVEVEIALLESSALAKAHGISQAMQYCLEDFQFHPFFFSEVLVALTWSEGLVEVN